MHAFVHSSVRDIHDDDDDDDDDDDACVRVRAFGERSRVERDDDVVVVVVETGVETGVETRPTARAPRVTARVGRVLAVARAPRCVEDMSTSRCVVPAQDAKPRRRATTEKINTRRVTLQISRGDEAGEHAFGGTGHDDSVVAFAPLDFQGTAR